MRTIAPLNPNLALPLKLKQNYLLNSKNAKSNVLSQPSCPDFPDALWVNVILNCYLNFDWVYSGYYALESDYRHTQLVGDIDLVINTGGGSYSASKAVTSHGEWAIAFTAVRCAYLFAYPHQANKFNGYEWFIIGQFAAQNDPVQHYQMLNLDQAKAEHGFWVWQVLPGGTQAQTQRFR